jgi:RNA polymerase sigma-70 factor (ECF subfamily)
MDTTGFCTEGQAVSIAEWSITVNEWEEVAETALLRAGQAGDRAALDQLLARHERRVLAVCHGVLGHADDAEDAAQETFLRALRSLPRFRGDSSFLTWLLRIAVNVSLNWRRGRRPTAPLDLEPAFPAGDSPETIVLMRLEVQEALRGLPAHRRAALLLREMQGWSVEEIGAAMGWSTKRVYNELFKARRAVAEWQARQQRMGGAE